MWNRIRRPRAGRLSRGLAPIGIVAAACGWAMLVEGCPSQVGDVSEARSTTPAREAEVVLLPVADSSPAVPSSAELLYEALDGVASEADGSLGSRMQVRPLRMPHPPRGATARFNFDGGRRGWITALPSEQLLTSPAYAAGKVFLGGGFASHRFFAFDAYDGEMSWTVSAPDGGPTAAIVEDRWVIFNTESCTLFVADRDTGALVWKRWLGDPLMSQPVASEGMVLSAYPANGAHLFGAFGLEDGEPSWTVPIPADIIQAPQVSGDSAYFSTMDGTAHRVRVRDGRVLWSRDVGASSAMWVDGDHVLLSRRVDRGGAPHEQPIVLAAGTGRIESRGELAAAPYLAGDSRDRSLATGQAGAWGNVPHGEHLGLLNVATGWAFQGSSPAIADGRAYFAVAGDIRARDMATGNEVWSRSYGAAEGAQAVSPPAVVGSQIFFGTVDGHLYAADIDTGMTLWAYDVGEPVVFQPIVAQGWVYVATGKGNLIGLEIGDPQLDGWHMWGGNARHAGLVETAGTVDPQLLASLDRPGQGTMRVAGFEEPEATDAAFAPPAEEAGEADQPQADLPLVRTRVRAQVSGFVARVTVTQQFDNPHDRPIEALYLFPLPADSAVDDMEMHVGSRVIRGRIQRRGQARRTYEQARESGRRAALLEQQRPNLFAQRVANIGAGERIDVQIQYVQMLPFEDGQYELVYPMMAPPRHDPGDPMAAVEQAGVVREAARVELEVELNAGMPVSAVASPTHRIEVDRRSPEIVGVTLDPTEPANRDFVLRYALGNTMPRATVLAHRDAGDTEGSTTEGSTTEGSTQEHMGHFSFVLQPPTAPEGATTIPRDLTFVVDTSSSMAGRPMEHARAIMERVLTGLQTIDAFNVMSFNDQVSALSDVALSGSESHREQGLEFVRGMRATGSTNMVPAIQRALLASRATPDGRLPIVVLLTDGFIGNEADVLRAIAEDLGPARLYAVGVGSATNRFLLERAAEIGRGRTLVTTLSESPQEVASRFAGLVESPLFTNVEIDWGGLPVRDVYPRRLPDLFQGKPLVVHGQYASGGTAQVRVRGSIGEQRYEQTLDVTLPDASEDARHAAHATLWARAAVHDRMNRLFLRDDPELIEEVTQLGLRHRMMTQWTSFVAVDETPTETADDDDDTEVQTRATVSPARVLPGDPEIRIPAPADARAVTVFLPFGETLAAAFEHELGLWTGRFLIPADAEEGIYPIEVLITHADGSQERMRVWYTVDTSAPLVEVELIGEARPGAEVTLRARQVVTEADLIGSGFRPGAELSEQRAQLLSDARRVELRTPSQEVVDMHVAGPGSWEATVTIPADGVGTLQYELFVIDLAANVRTQTYELEVRP